MEGRRILVSPLPCSGHRVVAAATEKWPRGDGFVNSVKKLMRREICSKKSRAFSMSNSHKRYGVTYTNHVESWNNVIILMRDLLIQVFNGELHIICSEESFIRRDEAIKNQTHSTKWATNHCTSIKAMASTLTYRVRTGRDYLQMTSSGRTDYVNIGYGSYFCRWWQMMGIPCEYGVCALGISKVDPIYEYYTDDIYKVVYEPI
ncbi:hypothetical protein GIB67_034170 [Kingdonia uniflora]|uniref:Zinc finger PMZ-type domain-containing protein n=1 Tax=Kingdonia uniflora TaxID=39325 RepID=A0A7J7NS78_9MAGN|nr:hypothetical protein GIB67_034170 [Kingdonia uniflora]